MEKNINLIIDDLRNNLVNMINESGLPIGVVELICKDLYTKVQNSYIGQINSARMKEMKSTEEIKQDIQEAINNNQKGLEDLANEQK